MERNEKRRKGRKEERKDKGKKEGRTRGREGERGGTKRKRKEKGNVEGRERGREEREEEKGRGNKGGKEKGRKDVRKKEEGKEGRREGIKERNGMRRILSHISHFSSSPELVSLWLEDAWIQLQDQHREQETGVQGLPCARVQLSPWEERVLRQFQEAPPTVCSEEAALPSGPSNRLEQLGTLIWACGRLGCVAELARHASVSPAVIGR